MGYYNHQRKHQLLNYQTPWKITMPSGIKVITQHQQRA
jgi:hypothetical protein